MRGEWIVAIKSEEWGVKWVRVEGWEWGGEEGTMRGEFKQIKKEE
jgi:hypothetical protein